jgi:hypothetical protein
MLVYKKKKLKFHADSSTNEHHAGGISRAGDAPKEKGGMGRGFQISTELAASQSITNSERHVEIDETEQSQNSKTDPWSPGEASQLPRPHQNPTV